MNCNVSLDFLTRPRGRWSFCLEGNSAAADKADHKQTYVPSGWTSGNSLGTPGGPGVLRLEVLLFPPVRCLIPCSAVTQGAGAWNGGTQDAPGGSQPWGGPGQQPQVGSTSLVLL